MKAPTKHRSMNATNMAERRVEPRRRRVATAQAQAKTETMKRTRMKDGVSWLLSLKPLTNHACKMVSNSDSVKSCHGVSDAPASQ